MSGKMKISSLNTEAFQPLVLNVPVPEVLCHIQSCLLSQMHFRPILWGHMINKATSTGGRV